MSPLPRSPAHPLRDTTRALPAWVRNSGALTLGFLGGGALLIFSLFAIPLLMDIEERGVVGEPVAFDSAEWKRNANYPFVIPIRSRMAGDLTRRRLLIGKTTREVEDLLGPADWRNQNPSIDLGYKLRLASSDYRSMLVDTENDVVESVRIAGG